LIGEVSTRNRIGPVNPRSL